MPLKLEIKRKLSSRSDRVKCVDLHPSEPWMLAALYNGNVHIWNIESQQLIKSFEVCQPPVRAARFIERKNWIVTGSDDMQIRVFNYNTLERVHAFEGHSDYIRAIVVHSTQPYILTSSDDNLIKLWNWEKNWQCTQVYEGHLHYVMCLSINPKDNNTFASCSLDKTIKVWNLGSPHANFTLEGHEKGVNCVDYYSGGDKPYLVSGADDRLVKIWDYQTKTCVQTLEGHAQNLSCVAFHPEFPLIVTGSEDSTVRLWHANTYRLESTLNYGLERVWTIACLKGSNAVALGYDEGAIVIKLGREEPAMSMDSSGKIVWARHAELQQANLKTLSADEVIEDGERLPLNTKDMGACEIYPQSISHSANGRFVAAVGDGEYIVYTAMALRNKSFGSAQEFVWSTADASMYAIRDGTTTVKVFKNFKEQRSFKPDFGSEQIFGGHLLGVRSVSGLAFYDWETCELVRRIEISPNAVHWNESGRLVSIVTEDTVFLLRYDASARDHKEDFSEDGFEAAFDLITNGEIEERVKTALWVGDCFLFTNTANRLQYYVGGELVTIAHMDRQMYLLGYLPKENRVYLGDRELNIVSYSLLLAVLEYQTAVMREDFVAADRILPTIPRDQRTRVAHFLEKQGFPHQALAVSTDPDHRFELACQLGDLKIGYQLAVEADSRERWQQLADVATRQSEFGLAQECMARAKDHGSLLLLASCTGNAGMLQRLAEEAGAEASTNVAFLARFLLGDLEACFDLLVLEGRLPEAAFFARSYLPSRMPEAVTLWKENLAKEKGHEKMAQALANPEDYENLFEGRTAAMAAESFLRRRRRADLQRNASDWDPSLMPAARNAIAELEMGEDDDMGAVNDHDGTEKHEVGASLNGTAFKASTGVAAAATMVAATAAAAPTDTGASIDDFERELERDLENLDIEPGGGKRPLDGNDDDDDDDVDSAPSGGGGGGADEDLDLDEDFEDFA